MASQIIVFAGLLAVVSAGFSHQTVSQRVPSSYYTGGHYAVEEPYIHNDDTIKHQHEARRLDVTHGQYRLVDPDGKLRLINYHADHHAHSTDRPRPRVVVPTRRSYDRPIHASNLHTVAVETPTIYHRQNLKPLGPRLMKSHSFPKNGGSSNSVPVSYSSISQVLPVGSYGQKQLRTTSHASQHPY
ncbi:hypothetical protein RP20_CCG011560 [Aedes albopictus]|nr:hypothetical protein RP20_CCG011560 [Aedes albopictus]